MEKEKAVKAMQKIGPMKFAKKVEKGYNNLCRRCKILSVRAVQTKTTDQVFDKYCPRCKAMLEKIQ